MQITSFGLRADESCRRLAQCFVIRIPWRPGGMMRIDSELCPIVQFLFDDCARSFRHQAERIPGEINQWLAVFARAGDEIFRENRRSGSPTSSCRAKSSSAEKAIVINQQQTSNVQRSTSNAQFVLSTLDYQPSTGFGDCMNSIVVPSGSRT